MTGENVTALARIKMVSHTEISGSREGFDKAFAVV
jgi:hypothetical protein